MSKIRSVQLVGVAGVSALLLSGCLFGISERDEYEVIESPVVESPSAEASPDAQPSPTAEPEPTEEAEPEWVEVASLSGTGDQRGELFDVDGDARITYEFTPAHGADILAVVYLMPEGQTLADNGGFPEVTARDVTEGSTWFYRRGTFYLDVRAANVAEWSVTVEVQQ